MNSMTLDVKKNAIRIGTAGQNFNLSIAILNIATNSVMIILNNSVKSNGSNMFLEQLFKI